MEKIEEDCLQIVYTKQTIFTAKKSHREEYERLQFGNIYSQLFLNYLLSWLLGVIEDLSLHIELP